MISTLLTAFLVLVAIVSLVSLIDSALRARNSRVAIRRELELDAALTVCREVSFVRTTPVVVPLRPLTNLRPAPRLPQAVAA